jgi:hypothetical protein
VLGGKELDKKRHAMLYITFQKNDSIGKDSFKGKFNMEGHMDMSIH